MLLTLWTIRLALILLAVVVIAALWPLRGPGWMAAGRVLWTAGCLLAVLHVIGALLLVHGGSWSRAYAHTAQQTREQIGWEFGAGIYFNLAFVAVWVADVAWCWLAPRGYLRRAPVLTAATVGFLLFIAFNATVVFEQGLTRLLGIAATAALALLMGLHLRKPRPAP